MNDGALQGAGVITTPGAWLGVFILFAIVVFALGYVARYFFERHFRAHTGRLERENMRMKSELSHAWATRAALPTRTDTGLRHSVINLPAAHQEQTNNRADDLMVIAGVTEKVASVLKKEGIDTVAKLAVADIARLQDIVRAHSELRAIDPITWPYQARLVTEGRWKDLAEYQNILKNVTNEHGAF